MPDLISGFYFLKLHNRVVELNARFTEVCDKLMYLCGII